MTAAPPRALSFAAALTLVLSAAGPLRAAPAADEATRPAAAAPAAAPVDVDVQDEPEEESLFGVGAEVDLRTRYVWHGLPLSSGPVVQPSVWGSVWQCSLTAWANAPLPSPGQDGALDEVDLGLTCVFTPSIVEFELSVWAYLFPDSDVPTTGEAKLSITVPIGWFRVFTAHGVDIGDAPGSYAGDVGVGGEWGFERFGLTATARVGWGTARFNDVNAGWGQAALDFAGADLALPFDLGAGLELRPHAGVSVLLPDALRDAFGERVVVDFGIAFGGEWPL